VAALEIGGRADGVGDKNARVVLFENAYKFGFAERFEVDLAFKHLEYVPETRQFAPPGPMSVRAKINVVRGRGFVPAVTLVPWIFFPFASSEAFRAGPLVFWGWELPFGFELEMNFGVLFSTRPKPPVALVLASALTYAIGWDLKAFVDIYATGWDIAYGTGLLFPIARDLQIDAGTYIGLNGDKPQLNPFLGFSFRR